MAKNESTKSKAEIYRAERKERIAKANKKNAKGNSKATAVAVKLISAVLIICVVLLAGWYLSATLGLAERFTTALKVGDTKVSTTLYTYYYKAAYQQTSYYSQYYSQYGMNMGYDSSLAPDDPANTTEDKDGNKITWAESFKKSAIERAQFVEGYFTEAKKAGYKLSDDEKSEINETVESYRDSASENGYSLNAYLKAAFGAGFNEKLFRAQLEKEKIAENFYNDKQSEFNEGITAEKIAETYKAAPYKYDYVDVRYYALPFTTLTAAEGDTDATLAEKQKKANGEVVAKAKEILAKITDEKSFSEAAKAKANEGKTGDDVTKEDPSTLTNHAQFSTLSSSFTEDGAKWVFDTARKAGDKNVIEGENNAFLVYIVKPAYTSNSVDVRHCFVNFNAADENNVTAEEKEAAKKKADELYAKWKSGEMTDASFATFASDNTEDTGSVETGGLYEGVRVSDSMYKEFLDWCFTDGRKEGDNGIIESQSGYHIMYMKKINTEDKDNENAIRTQLGSDAFKEYGDKLLADDGSYVVKENAQWIDRVVVKFCNDIKKNLSYSA